MPINPKQQSLKELINPAIKQKLTTIKKSPYKLLQYKFKYFLFTLSLPLVYLITSKLYTLGVVDYLQNFITKQYAITTNVINLCITKENFANSSILFKCIMKQI